MKSQLNQEYRTQRENISNYHHEVEHFLFPNYDITGAKELGNFDDYIEKVIIRNNAELNVFYDYLALYRKIENKRAICYWGQNNKEAKTKDNATVVNALEQARFSVLRIDENLDHGALRVTDVISKKEHLLIDNALNSSQKEGWFFVCSLLQLDNYTMTSGGGIPLCPKSAASKSALTLLQKHLVKLRGAKRPLNKAVNAAVCELYGFCLRGGALENMTIR